MMKKTCQIAILAMSAAEFGTAQQPAPVRGLLCRDCHLRRRQ
ncbi:MAG: hypothetical protein NTU53_21105 [Planctomycetota bacterium]|nr:hypothetical protein [Planctomycetota bacterium]